MEENMEIKLESKMKLHIDYDNTVKAYLKRGITKKNFFQLNDQILQMMEKCKQNNMMAEFELDRLEIKEDKVYFRVELGNCTLKEQEICDYLKTLAYEAVFQGDNFLQTIYAYLSMLDQNKGADIETLRSEVSRIATGRPIESSVAHMTTQETIEMPAKQVAASSVQDVRETVAYTQFMEPEFSDNGETGVLDPAFWKRLNHETESDKTEARVERSRRVQQIINAQLTYLRTGEKIHITKDGFRLGSGADVDYVVGQQGISRKHASIVYRNNTYCVMDLGSTNGTFINGRQVPKNAPIEIHSGDILRLAGEEWKFMAP